MRVTRHVTTQALGADLAALQDDRFLEDYPVGFTGEWGRIQVSQEDIISFALAFDPQIFHVDVEYAATGPFNGLIASGFHTNALAMRLFADHYLSWVASHGSPGLDEVRWPAPVRPGDRLSLAATVLEVRPSRSKVDRGVLRTAIELRNQDGVAVMQTSITNLLLRRPGT